MNYHSSEKCCCTQDCSEIDTQIGNNQMSLSTKILLAIVAVVLLGLGGFIVLKQIQNAKTLTDIQTSIVEQKQLLDNITRAQSQYVSQQDLAIFAKQQNIDLSVIKKDLDTLNARVVAIGGIAVTSTGQTATSVPSTSTTERPDPPTTVAGQDPFGYLTHTQKLTINEKFSNIEVPFGEVGFSAWQDKPWDVKVEPRKYSVTSVLGQDENGKHYSYSKFAVQTGDKTYDIKIDENKFLEEVPSAKFSFWNPRLFMTAGGGVSLTQVPIQGSANAGATLGIMSYGQFKTTPSISVLQLGVVYETGSQKPAAIINPISFNIGGILPSGLANNTYLGPSMQVDLSGNVMVGGNVSIGF